MMERVHFEIRFSKDAGQFGIGLEGHGMSCVPMIHIELRGDVLHKRSSVSNVDPLAAKADAKERFFGLFDPCQDQRLLKEVTVVVEHFSRGMRSLVPLRWRNIRTTRKQQTVQHGEILVDHGRAAIGVREDYRDRSRFPNGADVVVIRQAGNADQRLACWALEWRGGRRLLW